MKKVRNIIVLVLLVYAGLVFNKKASPVTDYYDATTNLNVRSGAGTKYPVSFTLQKGDEVEILSKNNSWYKIKYLEQTGYANSKYLEYSRTISYKEKEFLTSQQKKNVKLFITIGVLVGIVIPVGFNIFRKIRDRRLLKTVTEPKRGTKSERDLVLKLLKYGIPAQSVFHDLYVKMYNGNFSQIDLAVITEVGIIVFEVKDYSGWIFGSGNQLQWTQVLAYGKQKYRFYNPIMQNNKHIENLRKQLNQYGDIPFYSIVVFYGDCVFKNINFVPNGTFLVKPKKVLKVLKMILKNNETIQYTDKNDVLRVLKESTINGASIENQIKHVENIRDMLGKNRIFD